MASVSVFPFLLFSHLVLLLLSAGYGNGDHHKCLRSFDCGYLGSIHFPFTKSEQQHSGFIPIHGCDDPSSAKTIQLEKNETALLLKKVLQHEDDNIIKVFVQDQEERLKSRTCEVFNNKRALPLKSPLGSFHIKQHVTLFKCTQDLDTSPPSDFINHDCPDYDTSFLPPNSPPCTLQLPCKDQTGTKDLSSFSCGEIDIEVQLSDECLECHNQTRGQCLLDSNNNFCCDIENDSGLFKFTYLGLGLGLGGLFIGLAGFLIIIWRTYKHYNKQKYPSSSVQLQSANDNAVVPESNTDLESGRMAYFGIPVFSYEDLKIATNNFDRSRELGNGGFGTVYYGKLQDGREVAVKRLYDHNFRRIEQFVNEVNILTRLHHPNLVSIHGCTSRHSRELLLVYEYIPNGTVSCYLHCDLANRGLLPWSIRIKIAIETATALAYLHASDIIHRDVKTNNILLENNFRVKVADFGLSRLFPNDVTHVSTAPQGTPGYVDPEYYQCYQLTSKSDVYSFGVVLIELISSLPAVDIRRDKDEINLANLAINKIQKSAFRELVDPSLGFESNNEVRRMIVSVAELAFQCLQRDKELRPTMDEVLEMLKRIESGKEEVNHLEEVDIHGVTTGISHSGPIHPPSPPSPDCDEAMLLKNMRSLPSPKAAVADKWLKGSTTFNVSTYS